MLVSFTFKVVHVIIYEAKRRYAYCPQLNHFFQRNPFILVKTIPFSGSHFFQWKALLLVQIIPFSGNYYFKWKSFLLVEAIPSNEGHSFQWKPFLLVKIFLVVKTMPVVEAILFSESHFQREPLLFAGTTVRSGSHFLQ